MQEPTDPAIPTPARPSTWDILLAVLVVGFAFLAASFPARNSDLWLHLASGRLLASGEYVFGQDPFAYTTGDAYWANHAWLSDLALYLGYQTLGGTGLVVLKAVGIALLAALLLHIAATAPGLDPRRSNGPFWIAAGCVLLAVLAMSPRLFLQPACASLVLLAVCLWLLTRGGRALWALPLVIALWVNVDDWFLLGPLAVALFATGQLLAPAGRPRVPLWVVLACLVACLASPHHYHALTLPDELSPAIWGSGLRDDIRFAPLFASPWRWAPLGGGNLTAWAFFVLLALCLLSFACHRLAWRSGRLPVVLAFALLAAWQVRLVPFFAVVAGPLTALNLREVLADRPLTVVGRPAMILASLALAALTWPGWLHGFHRHDRALGWAVPPDPSLRRMAETLTRWRQEGRLPPGDRTFAVHPDVAHYCAWFAPGEKGFLDARLQLFLPVVDDYLRVCRAVGITGQKPAGEAEPPSAGAAEALRAYDVIGLVVYDPSLRRLGAALGTITRSAGRWEVVRIDGQALFVGWKGAPGATPQLTPIDVERAAFGAGEEEAYPPAPGIGPAELARPRLWWDAYFVRPGGSSWQADAGAVYLGLFAERAPQQLREQEARVRARAIAGLASLAGPSTGLPSLLVVASGFLLDEVFVPDRPQRPAALPLMAVRAARNAVALHPEDSNAWLVLANAYLLLDRTTAEATSYARLPPLVEVRSIQTVTALVQAVTLDPDLAVAHGQLAQHFTERGYLDLALSHRQQELRLTRAAEGEAGTPAGRIESLEQTIEELERVVQANQNRFIVRSDTLAADPLARARLAVSLGLGGQALEVLLASHPDLYGVEGLRLLLELLLRTGRAADARDLLDRDEFRRNPDGLGVYELPGVGGAGPRWVYRFPAHGWFACCRAAAAGDYNQASAVLGQLRTRMKSAADPLKARVVPALAGRLAAEVGAGAIPAGFLVRLTQRLGRDPLVALLVQSQFLPVVQADLQVLDGMLWLERGRPTEAGEQFRLALEAYGATDTVATLPGQPLARYYRDQVLKFRQ